MKRFLISTALFSLASLTLPAQNSVCNNPDNRAYFGIRVGGEITCPGNMKIENVSVDVFKNGGGIEFGGIYNLPVVANFYIEPGLKFYYNSYSIKDDLLVMDEDFNITDLSVRKFGLRIPVMAGYHFDFTPDIKLSVFTGPEFEIGLSGKGHVNFDGEKISESIYGEDGGMRRFDLLWGVGAGITYQNYYFGVSGGIGMLNMVDDDYVKFHENRVTLTLGYNF